MKYLRIDTNGIAETTAINTSAGAGDANKIVATGSDGRIHSSLMPVGIGAETKSITASEALSAGDLVNLWNDSGTVKCRKADASNARQAHGFVLSPVSADASATVYFEGTVTDLTGLTAGSRYCLSATTPGGVSTTIPTTAGQIYQPIGYAISTTELTFEPGEPIVRA